MHHTDFVKAEVCGQYGCNLERRLHPGFIHSYFLSGEIKCRTTGNYSFGVSMTEINLKDKLQMRELQIREL